MTATQLSAPTAPTAAESGRGSYWITTFGCQMNKADSEPPVDKVSQEKKEADKGERQPQGRKVEKTVGHGNGQLEDQV